MDTMHPTLPQLNNATNWYSNRLGEANIPRGRGDTNVCDKPPHVTIYIQIILQVGVVEGRFKIVIT